MTQRIIGITEDNTVYVKTMPDDEGNNGSMRKFEYASVVTTYLGTYITSFDNKDTHASYPTEEIVTIVTQPKWEDLATSKPKTNNQ